MRLPAIPKSHRFWKTTALPVALEQLGDGVRHLGLAGLVV
jgi:hypothetical protein